MEKIVNRVNHGSLVFFGVYSTNSWLFKPPRQGQIKAPLSLRLGIQQSLAICHESGSGHEKILAATVTALPNFA